MACSPLDYGLGGKSNNASPAAPSRLRRYYPKAPLSVIVLVVLVLGVQFLLLPRYMYHQSTNEINVSRFQLDRLDARLQKCAEYNTPPIKYPVTQAQSRTNPRWSPAGQNKVIVLKNATLFDGESFVSGSVDIVLNKGVFVSIFKSGEHSAFAQDAVILDLAGKYVTPGLVDMHSHHLAIPWPALKATRDENEMHPDTGPMTPQLRIVDSIKGYDLATEVIASGGVTTSLILPGSANIMGGEGMLVKNILKPGENSEFVVEDMLLEHGVPKENRRRFMKMACGENPKRQYGHTRMGNAWILRKHMERAKELMEKQDAWCLQATAVRESGNIASISEFMASSSKDESATDFLEYDSTIAMLRGKIGINIHCYEPEDFEDMISHSQEFGFRIQAFHHALSAWEVPEMIKATGQNITIATFAEFGFFKKEGYESNLWAGKILANHGVPVAYKSDHVTEETSAKYLLFQAATAHSFHLPEDLALQSVTSVPAKSLEIDHRIGYCSATTAGGTNINLQNGHVSPGLTAISNSLGLAEITTDPATSDGKVGQEGVNLDPKDLVFAKYGVHLEGKAFGRARLAGVTRAISPPMANGFNGGVSVGIKTSGKKTILNGGIFQGDVALHFGVGQVSIKTDSISSVSAGISKLRQIISDNGEKDNIYGRAVNGSFPLVVNVENEYDIMQLIQIKQDYPDLNLVLFGGSGAALVANELATAKIPLILTAARGAADTFEKRNALPGPPLSESPAAILSAAGVKFGLAIVGESDSHIHNTPIEASWAAKYAGLSDKQALDLVSRNLEEILGLEKTKDFVVYEGNPLDFGASVVVAFDGDDGSVSMCWPEST
ncbi:hypothetical protein LSUE1_G002182 [Lachnellula suecica]|uniref:Amidohydrolase-related domain-containing protein n=1 Tax=Lachnellula suecica TaxID=602035 RepID=A0A8T9C7L3_9HELO|nr:hypothetical protein LSUE1_G002182 [Lachnellula suecica]